MKLANKLTLTLSLSATLVLTGKAMLDVSNERSRFDDEALREERFVGRALAAAIGEVWRAEGQARALELVESAHAAGDDVEVRWVWVDTDGPAQFRPKLSLDALTAVRQGKSISEKEPSLDGDGMIVSYIPVSHGGPRVGALEISKSLADENRYIRRAVTGTLLATLAMILLFVAMAAIFGAWFITRPVRTLVEQLRRVGAGDLSGRLAISRKDELTVLAHEMNSMTHQLRHADRLTTVGALAAGIAHELGTPLHVVTSSANAIVRDNLESAEIKDNANVIAEQSKRMANIIRNLLDFARRRELQRELYDVRHVVEQSVNLIQPALSQRQVVVDLSARGTSILALVDLTQLQQAITNLLINAMHASSKGQHIEITVSLERTTRPEQTGAPPSEFVRIAVRDHGAGMSDDVKRSVFQPFFTTKPIGEGTGLGLPIASAIVEEHEGFIAVETELGKGSCFSIYLPLNTEPLNTERGGMGA